MARPQKIGMDYFPVDTTWDVKMQLIKAKYGLEGIGCIIELFKSIYREGYYIKWDADTRLLFAAENKITEDYLAGIVGFAADKGVFHAGKLDNQGVLTSRGIQKRWIQVARDSNRVVKDIDKNLDLISETRIPAQETKLPAHEIPLRNVVSGTDNPYIKEKESKEKKEEKTFSVLNLWYINHQAITARLVMPSDTDHLIAKDLNNRYPVKELERAVLEYWTNWPDYWFAVKNGDMKKPRADRRPVYLFASFAKNIEELLQSQTPATTEPAPAPRSNAIEPVLCPVCGTNETPDTRMRCRKCGFFLDPSWLNDPELIAEYKAGLPKEAADA